jgi:subtilisin family serine protease
MLLLMASAMVAPVTFAASNTSETKASALSQLSSESKRKISSESLDKLMNQEKQKFIVEYKNTTSSTLSLENFGNDKATLLAARKQAFFDGKQAVLGRMRAGDVAVRQDYKTLPVSVVETSNRQAFADLLNDPDVAGVYEIKTFEHTLAQSLPLINQPAAANLGYTGAGTTVVVLDTGVDFTRAAFGNCTAPGTPAACRVAVSLDTAPQDNANDTGSFHGTNVSAVVAGVAPGAQLAVLDVFTGTSASSTDILEGIDWAISNQAARNIVAINMSLGDSTSNSAECPNSWASAAFSQARAAGIIPVVASGNNNFSNGVSNPACTPGALVVGAVYDANFGQASWSNCTDATTAADRVTCFSNSGAPLDILAPGSQILAGGISMSGTSQATPHVAGAVAVLRSAGVSPYASPDETTWHLTATGVAINDAKSSLVRPRLNLAAAANDAINNSWKWQVLDTNPATVSVSAASGRLYQLHGDGKIWRYTGTPLSGWQMIDNNTATRAITTGGTNLYQLHSTGAIWKYTGTPLTGWQQLDNNAATKLIVADGNNLYQLHNSGAIWKYTGTPMTGWQLLDNNAATRSIVAAGGNLYQIHSTGAIWKFTGTPLTGWQQLDNNGNTKAIAAGGSNLYQIHTNGMIWKYTGTPMTGWQLLDNNPQSTAIAADANNLYQLHTTGRVWQYLGTPMTGWLRMNNNSGITMIEPDGNDLYRRKSDGQISKFVR